MDRASIKKLADTSNRETRRHAEKLLTHTLSLNNLTGFTFKTGKGHLNRVIYIDKQNVYIKTDKSKEPIKISFASIKRMTCYFLRVRIVERLELETFNKYNSSLFGLLAYLFQNKSRIHPIGNLLRLVMNGIRMFFSSFERSPSDMKLACENGAHYFLASYYYVRKSRRWRDYLTENNALCILDCGKYSEWAASHSLILKKRTEPVRIDEYIQFIKGNQDIIEHYFQYDEIGNWEKSLESLHYMESHGLTPIPIFHMGSPYEILDQFVEKGYPVIALGGTVNQPVEEVKVFFDEVFMRYPTQAFHGLGVSKADWLKHYTFWSCDSKTWITVRWKQIVLTKDKQVRAPYLSLKERMKQSVQFLTSLENPDYYSSFFAL